MTVIRHIILAALCVTFAGMIAASGMAQEVPRRSDSVLGTLSKSSGTIDAEGKRGFNLPKIIEVSENKAHMITLPIPVRKIVIGNEEIADIHIDTVNPKQVFVVSKSVGSTNVFFMDEDGSVIHKAEVRVSMSASALQAALDQLIPGENIDVTVFRDSVFLSGNVKSAPAAADAVRIASRFVAADVNVTNMIKIVGSQQVILQVRIAEMDRGIRKNLSANQALSLNTGAIDGIGLGDINLQTTSPSTAITAFATGTINHDFLALAPTTISALERQSLVKTLAEPTLTAVSGESASFISGGEIPVPTGVDDTGNAIIEFRDFGIQLSFTPVVLSNGRISLNISTEISEIDSTVTVTLSNLTVNGFKSKRTESTINLPSGGSLMLSGLLENTVTDTIYGLPFLKDLPVLGALFRSTEFQRDETELVITVTAYLAKPAGTDTPLALPSDGFEPASDIDIYLLGRLNREYGKGDRPFWTDPIKGPFGYMMK
jgi:pilus assembly protein CpaC